jgi:glycosyltransferase involved in cell wall biosynthesis
MGEAVWARTGVLLAPSITEAWGMAAVEALAHGIPVIAHPTPGLREALGFAGRYVDRDNVDAWESVVPGEIRAHLDHPDPTTARTCIARARNVEKQANDDAARFVAAVESLR